MAQRSKKSSLLSSLNSLPTDNASAEAAWRQALLLRELSWDERVTATKQLCAELQSQARMKLQEAERVVSRIFPQVFFVPVKRYSCLRWR
jgi:hypothetical protein